MMLQEIAKTRQRRINDLKSEIPYGTLEREAQNRSCKPLNLYEALKAPGLSVIAEVKRASPSKGIINGGADPVMKAMEYAQNGASAVSVLTERDYFLGSFEDLEAVRQSVSIPVLCKDFMLEEYQILYAYSKGADAILLIAALLDDEALNRLYRYAASLGLSVLLEVHDEQELLRAARTGGRIIGINNRNLKTFQVDLSTFGRLRTLIPNECAIVCESGIMSLMDAEYAYENGADAILVGEALMRLDNCGAFLRGLRAYG